MRMLAGHAETCPCTRCAAFRRALDRHDERPELAYVLERRLVDLFKQGSSMAQLADEHGLKVADVEAAIRDAASWWRR